MIGYSYGRNIIRNDLGRRADFCLVCRDVRTFSVVEIRSVFFFICVEIGRGRVEAYGEVCETCRVERLLPPNRRPGTVTNRRAGIEELIGLTNPSVRQEHADRLALEKSVASGDADTSDRVKLIQEAFDAFAPEVQHRSNGNCTDAVTGAWYAATAIATLAWFGGLKDAPLFAPMHEDRASCIGLGIDGAGVFAALVSMLGDVRRFTRRRILPRLARSLSLLRPTELEIAHALSRLPANAPALGKALRVSELASAIRRHDPEF